MIVTSSSRCSILALSLFLYQKGEIVLKTPRLLSCQAHSRNGVLIVPSLPITLQSAALNKLQSDETQNPDVRETSTDGCVSEWNRKMEGRRGAGGEYKGERERREMVLVLRVIKSGKPPCLPTLHGERWGWSGWRHAAGLEGAGRHVEGSEIGWLKRVRANAVGGHASTFHPPSYSYVSPHCLAFSCSFTTAAGEHLARSLLLNNLFLYSASFQTLTGISWRIIQIATQTPTRDNPSLYLVFNRLVMPNSEAPSAHYLVRPVESFVLRYVNLSTSEKWEASRDTLKSRNAVVVIKTSPHYCWQLHYIV